jgi:hypothetical protein
MFLVKEAMICELPFVELAYDRTVESWMFLRVGKHRSANAPAK